MTEGTVASLLWRKEKDEQCLDDVSGDKWILDDCYFNGHNKTSANQ